MSSLLFYLLVVYFHIFFFLYALWFLYFYFRHIHGVSTRYQHELALSVSCLFPSVFSSLSSFLPSLLFPFPIPPAPPPILPCFLLAFYSPLPYLLFIPFSRLVPIRPQPLEFLSHHDLHKLRPDLRGDGKIRLKSSPVASLCSGRVALRPPRSAREISRAIRKPIDDSSKASFCYSTPATSAPSSRARSDGELSLTPARSRG